MNRPCKFNQCRTLARLAGLFGLLFSVASGRALADTTTQPQPLRGPEAFARLLKTDDFDVDALLDALHAQSAQEFLRQSEIPNDTELQIDLSVWIKNTATKNKNAIAADQTEQLDKINRQLIAALDGGNLDAARNAASQAFDCRLKWLGPDDWETEWSLRWKKTLQQLADQPATGWQNFVDEQKLAVRVFDLWRRGDSAAALPLAKRCVRLCLANLGENEHSSEALLNLGAQYANLKQTDRAARCFTAAVNVSRHVFPHGHRQTTDTLRSLSQLLTNADRPLAGEMFARLTAFEMMRRKFSVDEVKWAVNLFFADKSASLAARDSGNLDSLNALAAEADLLFPSPHRIQGELCVKIGQALMVEERLNPQNSQREKARAMFEKAKGLYDKIGPAVRLEGGIADNESGLVECNADPKRAAAHFLAALKQFEDVAAQNPLRRKYVAFLRVKAQLNLSVARERMGDASGATSAAQAAADASASEEIEITLTMEHLDLDIVARQCYCRVLSGEPDICDRYADQFLTQVGARSGPESIEFADAAKSLGLVLDFVGRYEKGEALLRQALKVTKEGPLKNIDYNKVGFRQDPQAAGLVMEKLANCLRHQGKLTEAEQFARESLRDVTASSPINTDSVVSSLLHLRAILIAKGAFGEADALLLAATEYRGKDGRHGADIALATLYADFLGRSSGDDEERADYLDFYLAELDQAEPPTVAQVMHSFGLVTEPYTELARRANSVFTTVQALAFANDLTRGEEVWLTIANVARSRERALKALLLAGYFAAHQGSPESLRGASEQFDRAYQISSSIYGANHLQTLRCLARKAEAKLRLGELPEATQSLEVALSKAEQLRSRIGGNELDRGLFGETLQLHRTSLDLAAAHLLGEHKDAALAFSAMERGNTRAMMDLLSSSTSEPLNGGKSTPLPELVRLRQSMDVERRAQMELDGLLFAQRLKPRLDLTTRPTTTPVNPAGLPDSIAEKITLARIKLDDRAARVREQLGNRLVDSRPCSLADVQAKLRPGDVMLASQASDSFWVTLAVTHEHIASAVTSLTTEDAETLHSVLMGIRASVASRDAKPFLVDPKAVKLLGSWLSKDVRLAIDNSHHLIVLESPLFAGCPLDVLTKALGEVPLMKDKTIAYTPSGTFYVHQFVGRGKLSNPSLAAVGNPDFGAMASSAIAPERGAMVVNVTTDGIANMAGLLAGDVIVRVGDIPVSSPTDLTGALTSAGAGSTAKITYWRAGTHYDSQLRTPKGAGLGMTVGSVALAPFLGTLGDHQNETVADISQLERHRVFGGTLYPVPVTGGQARTIAKLFGADENSKVLLGKDATVQGVEEAVVGKRYVLLGTHGFTGTRDRPYDACIALTQPQKASSDDIGYLTMERVLRNWDGRLSDCDLVVLSACSTQRGQMVGDSMMSLPIGFMRAGARSVVASLWEVDGVATAVLMKRMFENLLGQYEGKPRAVCNFTAGPDKKLPKALALAEAKHWMSELDPEAGRIAAMEATGLPPDQLKLLTLGGTAPTPATGGPTANRFDFRNPYYWAAFVLVGDPD